MMLFVDVCAGDDSVLCMSVAGSWKKCTRYWMRTMLKTTTTCSGLITRQSSFTGQSLPLFTIRAEPVVSEVVEMPVEE